LFIKKIGLPLYQLTFYYGQIEKISLSKYDTESIGLAVVLKGLFAKQVKP